MTTHVQETTPLADAQAQLEDAQRVKEEIEARIADLEAQVHAGAAETAERQLAEEYAQRRLAELRAEAAAAKVRRAEAAALEERRRAAVAAAVADFEILSHARLAEALEAAVKALEELKRLGDARQAAVERHATAFVELGMDGHIVHQDGGWVVFTAGGDRYDNRSDRCEGATLVGLATGELDRRAQAVRRLEQGFEPPEPLPHPVTRHLAEGASGS
ncbi:hypothetical protein ACIF80_09610 [Streptomyces sp. NPDC085927]|uniref:hypothetical protein n=1 Tax=Streptomyces sp. NPDC085927 TaxID=3365738 RepID=UPI0037D86CDE